MSGRRSKSKGYRGEINLRNYLRQLGWEAERVPLSGSMASMPGDVRATKGVLSLLFECKNHSGKFQRIYELYSEHCKSMQDDLLSFVAPGEPKVCISLSSSLEAVREGPDCHEFIDRHPLGKKFLRTFKKIAGLQKLLGKADILALKENNKPFLFVRFR